MDAQQAELNTLDRAAILLLSMGEDAAAKIMSRLGRDEVTALSSRMAHLSGVSTDDAQAAIQMFFDSFRQQSGISAASRDYLERTLDKALGRRLARSMIDGIYGDSLREELQKLQWVPEETLARFFSSEHPQMQAVLLAFLPADIAAGVLSRMPEQAHDDLLYRVANMEDVSEPVLAELRQVIARCLEFVSHSGTARVDGVKQAADILNHFEGDRAGLMDLLKIHDEDLASRVSENMYDFMTLSRQSDDVLQAIVQEVPEELLALALKGAAAEVRDSIMKVLPRRMAQSLTERIQALGLVPVSQVEESRQELMRRVRELNEAEVIRYQIFQEKVVD